MRSSFSRQELIETMSLTQDLSVLSQALQLCCQMFAHLYSIFITFSLLPVGMVTLPSGTTPATTPSPCGANGYQCSDSSCITKEKMCDFAKDCSDGGDEASCGTCQFESGTCGWTNSGSGR